MPKVTSVEPQKNNPHRFNIFLDSELGFGADEDLIVENRLVVGKVIDQSLLEKLLSEAEVGKLMERMYRLWNVRARSEKEVRDYFRIKNKELKYKGKEQISNLEVELVIKKLKQKNLLNDEKFAKEWVEARRKSKQKGIKALKAELYQKGIDKETVEEVLQEQSDISEEQLAKQALGKKMEKWQALPYLEKKKKAYQFLATRGFEYEVIRNIVEKFIKIG